MNKRFSILKNVRIKASLGLAFMIPAALLVAATASAQTPLPVLTNAWQVHHLSSAEADRGYPVRVQGVVTYYDSQIPELFIQDETDGIFIEVEKLKRDPGLKFAVGQLLEVAGSSAKGGFSPDIVPEDIRLQGTASLPEPREVTYEEMAAGREDCRRVVFKGIGRSVGIEGFTHHHCIELAGAGNRVVIPIQQFDQKRARESIDAEVKATGVCATHFNKRGQLMRVAVQVASMEDISVLRNAPEAAGIPARKIDSLLKYAPDEEFGHRVKVRGVVTLQQPGQSLFITDETQGLYIQTEDVTPVQPGDRVEVLGFPLPCDYVSPVLQDAEFRRIDAGPPPQPIRIPAVEGFKDKYDATLVEMDATLMSRVLRERDQVLELEASNFIFHAELQGVSAKIDPLAAIPDRSRVRMTGVCLVPVDRYRQDKLPQSFRLLLRSPADVELLRRPSWWSAEHALRVLAATLAVFFVCLAWVVVLRRRVAAQTQIIRHKVQREAALEERARIARDLHDDLGAGLTHIAFLSQVAQKEAPCPQPLKDHLREISSSVQDSFQALDEIVWVVNPKNDTIDGLTNYICHFAEGFFRGTPTRCRLDLPTLLPNEPISTEVRNHLFFAVKEALNNVRKHARASEVLLRVRMEDGFFSLSIEDNGQGFASERTNPRGNGLLNMRRRLEKSGGEFELTSRPGGGTRIRLRLRTGPQGAAEGHPFGVYQKQRRFEIIGS